MKLNRKFENKLLFILPGLLFYLILALFFASCFNGARTADSSSPKEHKAIVKLKAPLQPKVELLSNEGQRTIYKVELAITSNERADGLMHRSSLADDRGMLFIAKQQTIQSFWMKNTLIPLDMIFIDEKMKVAGVIKNARPHDTSSHYINHPSKYVLEINGGQAERNNISAGVKAIFHDISY